MNLSGVFIRRRSHNQERYVIHRAQAAKVQADLAAFLASGRQIEYVDAAVSGEPALTKRRSEATRAKRLSQVRPR